MSLPSNLPSVADAPLPPAYERAKAAWRHARLSTSVRIGRQKSPRLASYAKQADDDSLQEMALRIQSRAVRRCGKLLETFQTSPQGGQPKVKGGMPLPVLSGRRNKPASRQRGGQEQQAIGS
jgi:hypothetical protein